eukprot:7827065-Heterocapsa_arctica.AAC.1
MRGTPFAMVAFSLRQRKEQALLGEKKAFQHVFRDVDLSDGVRGFELVEDEHLALTELDLIALVQSVDHDVLGLVDP